MTQTQLSHGLGSVATTTSIDLRSTRNTQHSMRLLGTTIALVDVLTQRNEFKKMPIIKSKQYFVMLAQLPALRMYSHKDHLFDTVFLAKLDSGLEPDCVLHFSRGLGDSPTFNMTWSPSVL
ncbi:unnamed protein product [Protopolystoma xenopodis]|uniref:Uncharacterized protein n=1 Tax=Protopolystoma xenopodis TaxID=117903 RepID=A0A448XE67_9PLAT|nr:unnamed protein product [Protopolystoma xenopodis]